MSDMAKKSTEAVRAFRARRKAEGKRSYDPLAQKQYKKSSRDNARELRNVQAYQQGFEDGLHSRKCNTILYAKGLRDMYQIGWVNGGNERPTK